MLDGPPADVHKQRLEDLIRITELGTRTADALRNAPEDVQVLVLETPFGS